VLVLASAPGAARETGLHDFFRTVGEPAPARVLPTPQAPDAVFRGRVAMLGCAVILGLYLCYFWNGWQQFGSRYTLDFTPFLMVAFALKNDTRERSWRWLFPSLVFLSIAINVWGVWWWQTHR